MMSLSKRFLVLLLAILATVRSQTLVKEQCSQISDVAFVMDSSGSISRSNFKREKAFVKEVASSFKLGPGQSQLAVISYSDDAQIDIRFGQYTNINDFNSAIDSVKHQRQKTRIDLALKLAASDLFRQARPDVQKVMVILTDGKQTITPDSVPLDVAVQPLQEMNVTIFALGVGKAIDISELLLLVGDNPDNLFRVENFNQLVKDSVRVAAKTCKTIRLPPVHGQWSSWTDWGKCSLSCGGGIQLRQRDCTNPRPSNGGRECVGDKYETRKCNVNGCPVNGSWSQWSRWDSCPVTCGGGTQKRSRTCTNPRPANGGKDCVGSGAESRECSNNPCPVNGSWSNWEAWSVCTQSCGRGIQARSRKCASPKPAHGGRPCPGSSGESRLCNSVGCPVDGNWSGWRRWTVCSKTCGGGTRRSTRTCTNPPPANGGKECKGEDERTQACNSQQCPVHGQWTNWKEWTECSSSCGLGTQRRFRTCTNPRPTFGGRHCPGSRVEAQACSRGSCPVDGEWSDWFQWTVCTKTCGGGMQRRSRTCTNPRPSNGGRECRGASDETRLCNTHRCPIHGSWTEWARWTTCTKTCGVGSQHRTRACNNPRPAHGGKECTGSEREARMCNTNNCPEDGNWSTWSEWMKCSKSCAGGFQARSRACTNPPPKHNGKDCSGRAGETRSCNVQLCPVHGNWSEWTNWRTCSSSCGGGFQTRTRACSNPPPRHGGKDCSGKPGEARPCNTQACPVDGQWSNWEDWTPCSKTCGRGEQRRNRSCTNPKPAHGGKQCTGEPQQIDYCNSQPCRGCTERADIAFLVDASESMTEEDFEKEKELIKKIMATFEVGSKHTQFALITFSSNAQVRMRFGDHSDLSSSTRTVQQLPFAAGGTRFDKAFSLAASDLFSGRGGVRPDLPKVMVIFTDGKQSADPDAVPVERAVLAMRDLGVRILVFAVGSQVDMTELQHMVKGPEDIIAAKDFDQLLENSKQIGEKTCEIVKRSEPLCIEKADVAFLLDASESMTEDDFNKQKHFVTRVAESFQMAPEQTQFALITYSSTAHLHIRFGDHMDRDKFKAVIDRLPFSAGGTRFDRALKLAADEVFTVEGGARPGVPKVMIILTDGRQSQDRDAQPLYEAVLPLRQLSVQIHAVAIGSQVDPKELRKFVQSDEDIFSIKDFDNLVNKSLQLARRTCSIITRPPPALKCSESGDLAFVVDTSGSIGKDNFEKQKQFVKTVASTFNTASADFQIGLITYSTQAQLQVSFRDKVTQDDFDAVVDRLPYAMGRTRIDKALQLALSELFTDKGGARPGKRRAMVILTDGRQSQDSDAVSLKEAVAPLRQQGVRIYTVAIGSEPDLKELYQLTERNEDLISVNDFDDLLNKANEVAHKTCRIIALAPGQCEEKINLGFVMDMSSSVRDENFQKQRNFVKAVANNFILGETETAAGVVTYNRAGNLWISFGQYNNNNDFTKAVDRIPYWGGQTRIDNGLQIASVGLFGAIKGVRALLPKILILLTDGQQSSDPAAMPLKEAALPLLQLGVKILAVGIGKGIDRDQLREIVERDKDIFAVDDFDDLLAKAGDIAQSTCKEAGLPSPIFPGEAGTYQSCTRNVDIGFVVDMSDSASLKDYQKQKYLVQRLVSNFDISRPGIRAGVIIYSDNAYTTIGLNSYRDPAILQRAIAALPRLGGGNRKDKALLNARRMLKSNKPYDFSEFQRISKLLVFITQGTQTNGPNMTPLVHAIHPLRRHGVRVIMVGIGRDVSYQELRSISQDPSDVYLASSLDNLDKISEELMTRICKLKKKRI